MAADPREADTAALLYASLTLMLAHPDLSVHDAVHRACLALQKQIVGWAASGTLQALSEHLALEPGDSLHEWESGLTRVEVLVRVREIASGLRRE